MYSIDYVKEHFDEFEKDTFIDRRFTKRFIDFIPTEEWEKYGFRYTGETKYTPKEWTEENILEQLKKDVEFGYEKAVGERGISSELMAMVVNAWCNLCHNCHIERHKQINTRTPKETHEKHTKTHDNTPKERGGEK